MLTDSFIVPTSLDNVDHPRPGRYLQYCDDLIEQYGTLDFRFSWNSYEESTIWRYQYAWWSSREDARNFRLIEEDWDLLVRMLFEAAVRIVQVTSDDDDPSSLRVRNDVNYRMKGLTEIRTILRWFDLSDWHHLFGDKEGDPALQQIEATPRFIKFLIDQVSSRRLHDHEMGLYLLPKNEMWMEDTFNLLRLQYPSKDPEYLPPSRILIEHEQKAERVLKEWERRTESQIAD